MLDKISCFSYSNFIVVVIIVVIIIIIIIIKHVSKVLLLYF